MEVTNGILLCLAAFVCLAGLFVLGLCRCASDADDRMDEIMARRQVNAPRVPRD